MCVPGSLYRWLSDYISFKSRVIEAHSLTSIHLIKSTSTLKVLQLIARKLLHLLLGLSAFKTDKLHSFQILAHVNNTLGIQIEPLSEFISLLKILFTQVLNPILGRLWNYVTGRGGGHYGPDGF